MQKINSHRIPTKTVFKYSFPGKKHFPQNTELILIITLNELFFYLLYFGNAYCSAKDFIGAGVAERQKR